jgi:hypothetical protein
MPVHFAPDIGEVEGTPDTDTAIIVLNFQNEFGM